MDKIDKKILSLLQENARYPLKHLASKVFLSSPAVSTRIERMEKAGAVMTTYESVLYELLKDAKAEGFKEISKIVK